MPVILLSTCWSGVATYEILNSSRWSLLTHITILPCFLDTPLPSKLFLPLQCKSPWVCNSPASEVVDARQVLAISHFAIINPTATWHAQLQSHSDITPAMPSWEFLEPDTRPLEQERDASYVSMIGVSGLPTPQERMSLYHDHSRDILRNDFYSSRRAI